MRPRSLRARSLRRALLMVTALAPWSGAATAAPDPRATPAAEATPPTLESAAERRAVRGVPIEDAALAESPELRELRRFEEQAFPRSGKPPVETVDPAAEGDVPAQLEGRWNGSGDVPPVLRTPESSRQPARAPQEPESAWLRSLKLPELPVRFDPRVVRYLEFFKSDPKGRAIMAGWIRRLGRYQVTIERVLEREGLPKDLVYLAMVESGFEPGAVSRVGAGGVWQFMPGAARAYGLEVSYWVDRRRDPERAAEAAARYLKDLFVRFGSWPLAFAAYNAGYGAVLKAIASFNSNDYWELCRHEAGMPWETTLYVPKILAAAVVGHNRQAFGFAEVASDPPLAYDTVDVPPGATLATVARAAGTTVEVVQQLNPELVRGRVAPDRGPSRVRLPVGAASLFAESFDKHHGPSDRLERVVLRFGETLDDLARARGIAPRELRRLNGLKDSGELRGGTTVLVPARALVGSTVPPAARATEDAGKDGGEDDLVLVAVPDRVFSYEGRERVFYRTRDADTLEEIAEVFQVRADEIVEWNNLDPDAKLQPKMVLQLYVSRELDRAAVALLDPATVRVVTLGTEEFHELEVARRGKTRLFYTARPGDTLAKIARRYGLAPGDLARINRLSYNADLSEGQRIVVYSPTPDLPREITAGRTTVQHRRPTETARPVATKGATGKGAATAIGKTALAKPAAAAGAKPGAKGAPAKPNPATGKAAAPAKGKTSAKPTPAPQRAGRTPGRR